MNKRRNDGLCDRRSLEVSCGACHKETDFIDRKKRRKISYGVETTRLDRAGRTNQPKQTQDATKDLNNKDLDEQVWVSSIGQSRCRACDADADTAKHVTRANSEAAPEDGEAGKVVLWRVELCGGDGGEFCGIDDADDLWGLFY